MYCIDCFFISNAVEEQLDKMLQTNEMNRGLVRTYLLFVFPSDFMMSVPCMAVVVMDTECLYSEQCRSDSQCVCRCN